eukprot:gene33656-33434_t
MRDPAGLQASRLRVSQLAEQTEQASRLRVSQLAEQTEQAATADAEDVGPAPVSPGAADAAQERRPARITELKEGAVVEVKRRIDCYFPGEPEKNYDLYPGLKGIVKKVKDTGHARVQWYDDVLGLKWLLKKDFGSVKLIVDAGRAERMQAKADARTAAAAEVAKAGRKRPTLHLSEAARVQRSRVAPDEGAGKDGINKEKLEAALSCC